MTAFADSFRQEVARLVRKETKNELIALRKSLASARSEIAAMKKELRQVSTAARGNARLVMRLAQSADVGRPEKPKAEKSAEAQHSVGEQLRAKREALGLTQQLMAQLLGVSSLSVYKWETQGVQPRKAQLDRLTMVLKMSKRKAMSELG